MFQGGTLSSGQRTPEDAVYAGFMREQDKVRNLRKTSTGAGFVGGRYAEALQKSLMGADAGTFGIQQAHQRLAAGGLDPSMMAKSILRDEETGKSISLMEASKSKKINYLQLLLELLLQTSVANY